MRNCKITFEENNNKAVMDLEYNSKTQEISVSIKFEPKLDVKDNVDRTLTNVVLDIMAEGLTGGKQ